MLQDRAFGRLWVEGAQGHPEFHRLTSAKIKANHFSQRDEGVEGAGQTPKQTKFFLGLEVMFRIMPGGILEKG